MNLWTEFPLFSSLDASKITASQSKHLDYTIESTAKPIWRYLNDICASCSITMSNRPRTFFAPLTILSDAQLLIFAPAGGSPQVFISELRNEGQHLFPSLRTVLHFGNERREAEVIGFDTLPEGAANNADQYTAAIFEALTDLHFWGDSSLRRRLVQEVTSGCLDGHTEQCPILNFARSLFRFRNDLSKTKSVVELRQVLCSDEFAVKSTK